ncbi:helix loop helix DNA-binding domain protein [Ceratobasidium sp. AG-Ba]|nr:helix loop helix DNA-binding domain protein [Ceratobasidium sp. AG-Ba]
MPATDNNNLREPEAPFALMTAQTFHTQPESKSSSSPAHSTDSRGRSSWTAGRLLDSRPYRKHVTNLHLENATDVSNGSGFVLPDSSHSHSLTIATSAAQNLRQGVNGRGVVEVPLESSCHDETRSTNELSSAEYAASNAGTVTNRRDSRRRDIRAYQIESEQRRRNHLRSGFARLKEALPASHEKCSKVALLERAAIYISFLEARLQEKEGVSVISGLTASD